MVSDGLPFRETVVMLEMPQRGRHKARTWSVSKEHVQSGSLDRSFTVSTRLFVILMLTIPG